MNASVSAVGSLIEEGATLLLNGDAVRYLQLGIGLATNGVAAWNENKDLQKTWGTNAQAILDRAAQVQINGGDPSSVKPTPEEWAAVRDFEDAAFEASQVPLTHEGPAAT